jgi:hypothetical protein
MGSTCVARQAGTSDAHMPTASTSTATAEKVAGSALLTPYTNRETTPFSGRTGQAEDDSSQGRLQSLLESNT